MNNYYLPQSVVIEGIKEYTPEFHLYTLKFKDKRDMSFVPGQFIVLSILGYEEAVFGVASSPLEKESFDICVRKVGTLTRALDGTKVGDEVGIRGPYGNGFPLEVLENKDLILAAGGTGIAPIASLAEYLIANRSEFNNVYLLYGARTPSDLLFSDQFERWNKSINVHLTVEKPDGEWNRNVGMITSLCETVEFECRDTAALMCGPPVMYRFMVKELEKLGVGQDRTYVSLEMRMRCGIGKCQHCSYGKKYVCLDGPVFSYQEIADIPEEG
jgi:NAD(P)H-flavin reductase